MAREDDDADGDNADDNKVRARENAHIKLSKTLVLDAWFRGYIEKP